MLKLCSEAKSNKGKHVCHLLLLLQNFDTATYDSILGKLLLLCETYSIVRANNLNDDAAIEETLHII